MISLYLMIFFLPSLLKFPVSAVSVAEMLQNAVKCFRSLPDCNVVILCWKFQIGHGGNICLPETGKSEPDGCLADDLDLNLHGGYVEWWIITWNRFFSSIQNLYWFGREIATLINEPSSNLRHLCFTLPSSVSVSEENNQQACWHHLASSIYVRQGFVTLWLKFIQRPAVDAKSLQKSRRRSLRNQSVIG